MDARTASEEENKKISCEVQVVRLRPRSPVRLQVAACQETRLPSGFGILDSFDRRWIDSIAVLCSPPRCLPQARRFVDTVV